MTNGILWLGFAGGFLLAWALHSKKAIPDFPSAEIKMTVVPATPVADTLIIID